MFEYTGKEEVPKDVTAVRVCHCVSEIDDEAFFGCLSLREVVLNEGLRRIGKRSFARCSSLESIKCSSTVVDIDDEAFSDCFALREVIFNEGLKKIGVRSFRFSRLEKIGIPSTVAVLGNFAFLQCYELNDVVLDEGLQRIGTGAFSECRSLEIIKLPSTVHTIGPGTFWKCYELSEVVLNEGLQTIGNCAFGCCRSLESINFSCTVSEIGAHAFRECNLLKSVVLNETLQKIGKGAFSACPSLRGLGMPYISLHLEKIRFESDQAKIVRQIFDSPGILFDGVEVFISKQDQDWTTCKESLNQILRLIAYYEMREATTIFELAFWKAKMEEENITRSSSREMHRAEVPGPVRDTLLQFLYPDRRW
mmetsp:Transcript_24153/g.41352  ORF Transcript_24153/g.41352 Transcript_24153/m.41352 type:complete len:365 (+) Transcript_24153:97-1191(+)